jgi:hypothetical protein
MKCNARSLSLCSLGFGLLATGALALAVSTDYWIYTMEKVVLPVNAGPPVGDGPDGMPIEMAGEMPGGMILEPPGPGETTGTGVTFPPMPDYPEMLMNGSLANKCEEDPNFCENPCLNYPELCTFTVKLHAGLWRSCMIYDDGKHFFIVSIY